MIVSFTNPRGGGRGRTEQTERVEASGRELLRGAVHTRGTSRRNGGNPCGEFAPPLLSAKWRRPGFGCCPSRQTFSTEGRFFGLCPAGARDKKRQAGGVRRAPRGGATKPRAWGRPVVRALLVPLQLTFSLSVSLYHKRFCSSISLTFSVFYRCIS